MSNAENDDIAEMLARVDARVARLIQRLEGSEITEVIGVVHPSGPGGSRGRSSSWTFLVSLKPWRRVNGTLQNRDLVVRKNVSEDELKFMMDTLTSYSVVHLRMRVSEECAGGDTSDQPQGLLLEVVNHKVNDSELQRIAEDLRQPKFFRDDFFGKLKLDRRLNWLEGTRRKGFSKYRIFIERAGESYDARMAWDKVVDIEGRMKAIKQVILDELFETYDTCWESLGKLSPERFLKKIRLRSIHIDPDGSSSAWFEDGGLFLGHDIEVRISKEGQIERTHLQG